MRPPSPPASAPILPTSASPPPWSCCGGACRAGRRWAAAFDPPEPDDPIPGLVEVLDRLGFDPEDDDGPVIRLPSCPFREAAREHPEVVCAVHRGLVDELLDGTTHAGRLLPFVEPQLCLIAVGPAAAR